MAKNFVCTGAQMAFVAPAGGVVAGKPIKMGALTVVPLENATAGAEFTGALSGVWSLPCDTALTTVGTAVKWDGAKLVANLISKGVCTRTGWPASRRCIGECS